MRKNQLISAIVILLVLAVLSMMTRDKEDAVDYQPGTNVFSSVDSDNLGKIVIENTGTKAKTELTNKDNKWVLKDKYSMDADPAIIRKLFAAVNSSKAIHVVKHTKEDLSLFQLDENNTIKVHFYPGGSDSPLTFRLGKGHSFKKESSGRYIYIEELKVLVLADSPLSFVTGQPNIWLKKFLPYHEQVAGVTFYSGTSILWKTERNSPTLGFSLPFPKNNNKSPQQINELMVYAMQMRFMDIIPATNDFTIDPDLKGMALYYSTFSGRTYKLAFLKKEGHLLRCSLQLIANKVKSSFVKEYGEEELLKEELLEWHYTVPYKFYEMLFKL